MLLEFPCKRMLLAEHLASVGIRTQPIDIKCIDEEDAPIQVKSYGESEFGSKLASLISPENSLQVVNSWCDIYHNLPYANKQKIQSAVLNGEGNSIKELGELLINQRMNPEETEEIRDYIISQAADGYGEGLEQREIRIPEGDMYVRFWHSVMITSCTTNPNSTTTCKI